MARAEPTHSEMIALAHAVHPALVMLDVEARKPVQGEAMHKVIGYHAFGALRPVGVHCLTCGYVGRPDDCGCGEDMQHVTVYFVVEPIEREGGSLLRTPRPPAEQVKSDVPGTASENADSRVGPYT